MHTKKKGKRIDKLIETASPGTSNHLRDRKLFKRSKRDALDDHLKISKELFKQHSSAKWQYLSLAKHQS
jgi:hypothetical protein